MSGPRTIRRERIFRLAPLAVAFALSLAVGYSVGILGKFTYFMALIGAVILLVMTIENRSNVLFFFVIMAPLAENFYIHSNLFDIPGMRPFNLLGALLLVVTLIRPERPTEQAVREDVLFTRYFVVYFLIFVVAVLRAVPTIPSLHLALPEVYPGETIGFLLTHLIRPSLFLAPMLFIVYNVVTQRELDKAILAVIVSMFIYSLIIVFLFFNFKLWSSGDWHRYILLKYLGYHYNFLATHLIVTAPILFQKALTRKPFYVATFILAALAVACLKSRTAYAIFVFAIAFMLWFTGRRKIFPIAGLLIIMIGPYVIPSWLLERATFGFSSGDINEITADRLDLIWVPLIEERIENIFGLLFGEGRFSMVLSKSHLRGVMIAAWGAHNAFLEMILDSGLIVTVAFTAFMAKMGKKLLLQARTRKDDFFWAIIGSYVCFLLSCLTDRVFYPDYSSAFVFIITGILIVYIRLNPVTVVRKEGPVPDYVNPVFDKKGPGDAGNDQDRMV